MLRFSKNHDLKGVLICVEGIDGSGKSTQLDLLYSWLKSKNLDVILTCWNSSDLISETTKRAKKKNLLSGRTFSLLHAVDFADRLEKVIIPAMKAGFIVLADIMLSYPDMSSTCELCFRIIAAMGLYGDVTKDCATALLTGIITDTRNFTVNCKHPDLYEILMHLLEKGVDKEMIVREALNTRSYWSLKLEAFAISERMKVFQQHRCSLIALSKEDLDKFHYDRGDTEGLVNRPLEVKDIVYSIFMREDSDCVKVSARSKDGFPVSEICKDLYGGGGHLQAAGGEYYGTLEDCKNLLVENLNNYDKYLPKENKKLQKT